MATFIGRKRLQPVSGSHKRAIEAGLGQLWQTDHARLSKKAGLEGSRQSRAAQWRSSLLALSMTIGIRYQTSRHSKAAAEGWKINSCCSDHRSQRYRPDDLWSDEKRATRVERHQASESFHGCKSHRRRPLRATRCSCTDGLPVQHLCSLDSAVEVVLVKVGCQETMQPR